MQNPTTTVTATTVRSARRSQIGRKLDAAPETWAERTARVNAERAARRAQRETTTCPGWGEECGLTIPTTSDLCPDCTLGRLETQSPRIAR